MTFVAFLKRSLATAKIAVQRELEYRSNFVIDTLLQPSIVMVVEVLVWASVLSYSPKNVLGGFSQAHYISYALWGAFFSRIAANWMYEIFMSRDIETGSVNSILLRPISFFEYYLFQFMGYKFLCMASSFVVPISLFFLYPGTTQFSRLPLAIALCILHLCFTYFLSFSIVSLGFFLHKNRSLTTLKNISLWIFTGELFPLDLLPQSIKAIFIGLPFASGVYIPVAYLTGRVDISTVYQGFFSVSMGILVFSFSGWWLWRKGREIYTGIAA